MSVILFELHISSAKCLIRLFKLENLSFPGFTIQTISLILSIDSLELFIILFNKWSCSDCKSFPFDLIISLYILILLSVAPTSSCKSAAILLRSCTSFNCCFKVYLFQMTNPETTRAPNITTSNTVMRFLRSISFCCKLLVALSNAISFSR